MYRYGSRSFGWVQGNAPFDPTGRLPRTLVRLASGANSASHSGWINRRDHSAWQGLPDRRDCGHFPQRRQFAHAAVGILDNLQAFPLTAVVSLSCPSLVSPPTLASSSSLTIQSFMTVCPHGADDSWSCAGATGKGLHHEAGSGSSVE